MAPVKPIKTYSRTRKPTSSKSSGKKNELFELKLNNQHRAIKKKKQVVAKQVRQLQQHLSGCLKSEQQLWNNSVNVTVNDTFDKLLKGEMCRPVVLKENVSVYKSDISSSSSSSSSNVENVSENVLRNVILPVPPVRVVRKKQKRKKQVKRETIESSVRKKNYFDESVHTSLEVQKCNMSSLFRYNTMTSINENNGVSIIEQNSEIISPKIYSTPIIQPVSASPVSSGTRLSLLRKKFSLAKNDKKLLMVPYVRLNQAFNNCLEVIGVQTGSVSLNKSEIFQEKTGFSALKHSTPLTNLNPRHNNNMTTSFSCIESEKDISHSTPVSYVNKRRRGRPATRAIQLFSQTLDSDSVKTSDISELLTNSSLKLEQKNSVEPQNIYITLRSRYLIRQTNERSKTNKSQLGKVDERSISDMFASGCDTSKSSSLENATKSANVSEQEVQFIKRDSGEKPKESSVKSLESLELIDASQSNDFCVIIAEKSEEKPDKTQPAAPEEKPTELNNIKQETQPLPDNLYAIAEKSKEQSLDDDCFIVPDFNTKIPPRKPLLALKPGKSWRRSLSLLRRSSIVPQVEEKCVLKEGMKCDCVACRLKRRSRRMSIRIVPVVESNGEETNAEIQADGYVSTAPTQEDDQVLEKTIHQLPLSLRESLVLTTDNRQEPSNAREIVLRKCAQTEPLPFAECYPNTSLQHCHKIGEGVYGEVFLKRNASGGTSVMKVIPIEGTLVVNGDRQKKFEEILSEILIALALSDLRYDRNNQTSCFSEVQRVRCVQGRYPERLLELWDLYNEVRQSENDSPEVFPDSQLFIVLELANGGTDLESFVFANALQCYSVFKQVACALAVAENAFHFEHRDLHWGNILISHCDKKKDVKFILDNKEIEIATYGAEACIIDFTLSRITYDGVVVYNDLSQDEELFTAEGDYQFEIYRLMQEKNGNEWQHFEPYTNILWLHYVLDKMLVDVHFSHTNSKMHKSYLMKLRNLKRKILNFDSVKAFVTAIFY